MKDPLPHTLNILEHNASQSHGNNLKNDDDHDEKSFVDHFHWQQLLAMSSLYLTRFLQELYARLIMQVSFKEINKRKYQWNNTEQDIPNHVNVKMQVHKATIDNNISDQTNRKNPHESPVIRLFTR